MARGFQPVRSEHGIDPAESPPRATRTTASANFPIKVTLPIARTRPLIGSRTSPATTAHARSCQKEARRQLSATRIHRHRVEAEADSA